MQLDLHGTSFVNLLRNLGELRSQDQSLESEDEFVCWSRMQTEAGQQLEAIVARKELERRAGGGTFFWGVGNPPAVMTRSLSQLGIPVRVVFSIMKTRPKAVDVAPSRTVAWRRYFAADGSERLLPPHALVTSRGDSASGAKRVHYALMCHSAQPLTIRRGVRFDPTAFRNAGGSGAPVGASQVTALTKRVAPDTFATDYEANLTAWLTGSYWVRLSDPIELNPTQLRMIVASADADVADWCEAVALIRAGARTDACLSSDLLI